MFGFGKKDAFDALYGPGGLLERGVIGERSAPVPIEARGDIAPAGDSVEATPGEDKPVPVIQVSDLPNAQFEYRWHDGESYAGGFGPTQMLIVDYWTLRARSAQLYET